ncbi:MAG: gamma-glutamylcyclotransferase [Planctomycetota bacterium]|nr:gamma-glutamylcyclotransferase [Planctomycetota bacterium]
MSTPTPAPIFFYGLFMDEGMLRDRGLHPLLVGAAALPGYRIHLGARATLVRAAGARCYGMLIELPQAEAEALYSPPDVRDYRAESVEVELLDGGQTRTAAVYNLPADMLCASRDHDYAVKLAALVRGLGLPPAYADEIAAASDSY